MAKNAAIAADSLGDRKLSEVSAADFLGALHSGGLAGHLGNFLPEKKKYELEVEPGFTDIRVGDLLRGVREKKKLELEKPSFYEFAVGKQLGPEVQLGPQGGIDIERLADAVATKLQGRLGGTGGVNL